MFLEIILIVFAAYVLSIFINEMILRGVEREREKKKGDLELERELACFNVSYEERKFFWIPIINTLVTTFFLTHTTYYLLFKRNKKRKEDKEKNKKKEIYKKNPHFETLDAFELLVKKIDDNRRRQNEEQNRRLEYARKVFNVRKEHPAIIYILNHYAITISQLNAIAEEARTLQKVQNQPLWIEIENVLDELVIAVEDVEEIIEGHQLHFEEQLLDSLIREAKQAGEFHKRKFYASEEIKNVSKLYESTLK